MMIINNVYASPAGRCGGHLQLDSPSMFVCIVLPIGIIHSIHCIHSFVALLLLVTILGDAPSSSSLCSALRSSAAVRRSMLLPIRYLCSSLLRRPSWRRRGYLSGGTSVGIEGSVPTGKWIMVGNGNVPRAPVPVRQANGWFFCPCASGLFRPPHCHDGQVVILNERHNFTPQWLYNK